MAADNHELSLFFEESTDLLCILGPDGQTIEKVNSKAWASTLGYDGLQVQGRSIEEFLHPHDKPTMEGDLSLHCRDGNYRWISWKKTISSNGKVFCIGRDVTEAKSRQEQLLNGTTPEELMAGKRRLQESLEISKLGQWDLDLTTDSLQWSPEIFRLFQIDSTNFGASYESFLNAIHPDDREMVNVTFLRHLETKEPYEIIHRLLLPDKSVKWVIENCRSEYSSSGSPLRSIGTIQDITELKQAQEDLRIAKEKAEDADCLKSAFLANMSHEIRTPMNAVIGFTDLMLSESSKIPEDHRDYLETINTSGKLLLTLINDILDISKIEAGQLQLESMAFSLGEMLRTVEYNARGVISRKEGGSAIHFITPDSKLGSHANGQDGTNPPSEAVAIPGTTQDMIIGDPNRLQQVMNNLLSNAVKFTDSGTVEYTVKRIVRPCGQMLQFSVSDSGIGIPIDKQMDIFEPFRQAHGDKGACTLGGTGLGLAIARKLVEKMGGDISLESSIDPEDHGSVFSFTIPFTPAVASEETQQQNRTGGPASGSNLPKLMGKVLLVDDNRVNLKLATRFVTKMGCEAETAENGDVAIAKFRTDRSIDVILMDKEMPVMDGLEAVRAIRTMEARENRTRIPIVAVTAAAMVGDREECLDAGCDGYLTKPLSRTELHATLAKFLKAR